MKKIVCLFVYLFASSANAVVIDAPSQSGIESPLTFTFNGLAPSSSNVTFSVFAEGDLGFDLNEFLNVSIGTSGGTLTDFGNFFDSTSGFTTYTCSGFACISGTVDIILSSVLFNSFGSSVDVLLTPGSGVNNFTPNSAQVSLSYDEITSVPEPASLVLLGLGLAGITFSRKKKSA